MTVRAKNSEIGRNIIEDRCSFSQAGHLSHEIESITGMSPAMIMRYSRFADQKKLAKSAQRRLKERTSSERGA